MSSGSYFAIKTRCDMSPELRDVVCDDVLLTKPAARFCHNWELAKMFIKKLCKLKMRTSLTSVQIHKRKYLENMLIISISHGVIV